MGGNDSVRPSPQAGDQPDGDKQQRDGREDEKHRPVQVPCVSDRASARNIP